MVKKDIETFCQGCCQRVTCDHDLEKCCYLVKRECMLKDGYVITKY